jgi:hypothetical protein
MTTAQATKDNMTKRLYWSARGIGLLAGAMALLVISSVAGEWFLKIALSVCQPTLENGGPSHYTLCLHLVGAMGGWTEEIAASPWPVEGTRLAGLLIITVLGVLIAWSREGIGGVLLVAGAIMLGAFSYVTAEHDKVWNMLFIGGPFLVAGILFLACWRQSEEPALSPALPVPSAAEGSKAEGEVEGRRT